MDLFYAPIQPFIMHPGRIALVAGFLFVASIFFHATQRRAWPAFIAGIGWVLFAIWESYCNKQGYNIRVDLFVIVPVLYSLTVWGLLSVFYQRTTESTDCDDS